MPSERSLALRCAAVLLAGIVAPRAAAQAPEARATAAFVPNLGQWDGRARFAARIGVTTAWLEERGWVLELVAPAGGARPAETSRSGRRELDPRAPVLRGAALRLRFAGAAAAPRQAPRLVAEGRLPGLHHYFLGDDPSRWRTEVPRYRSVRYEQLYHGVDLRLRDGGGALEYDLLLAPGAVLGDVVVAVEGASRLRLGSEGQLIADTPLGPLVQPPPLSWELDEGGRVRPLDCGYRLLAADRFGFVAPARDTTRSLVVDPKLVFSTFLGGSDFEYAGAIAVDAAGRTWVGGHTLSRDFPTTVGALQPSFRGGVQDAFVSVLDPTGATLVFSTYFGGGDAERVFAIDVDAAGTGYVAGATRSRNFPVSAAAFGTVHGGSRDAFLACLDPLGNLRYSTLFGASGNDAAFALRVDAQGAATIAGQAEAGLPAAGGFQASFGGGIRDGFVARIAPNAPTAQQLEYCTYLGTPGDDVITALALGTQGLPTVAGLTDSPAFPVSANAFQPGPAGAVDVFVSRLDPALPPAGQILWSTYFGGDLDETVWEVHAGTRGVTLCGETRGGSFPTTPEAFDPSFNGATNFGDGYVARLADDGGSLLWSTFVGGAADDQALDLSVDAQGAVTVVGWTQEPSRLPTTPDALKRVRQLNEGYVCCLDEQGRRVLFASYLGGSSHDGVWYVAAAQPGVATMTGATVDQSFPVTPGAYDPTFNNPGTGAYDAFVTRLRFVPDGVVRYGDPSRDCAGRDPTIHALDDALPAAPGFGLALSQAAASATPVLVLALSRASVPLPSLGVLLHFDPQTIVVAEALAMTPDGEALAPIVIPAGTTGRAVAQFVLADPVGCSASPFSASDALLATW